MTIDYDWQNFSEPFVGFILPSEHCKHLTIEAGKLTNPIMPYDMMKNTFMPSDEFVEWAEHSGVRWCVVAVWLDGCSIYVHEDDAPLLKLSFGLAKDTVVF